MDYLDDLGLKADYPIDLSRTLKTAEGSDKYSKETVLKLERYEATRRVLNEFLDNFIPEHIGWKITHKYRSKNVYNATILKNQEFIFDKEMKSIIDIKDIE